jgi:hypothetical protein
MAPIVLVHTGRRVLVAQPLVLRNVLPVVPARLRGGAAVTDAIDQIVTLLSAASTAENIGTKLVYVAEARARLSTVIARTETARIQLEAMEAEIARIGAMR